MKAAWTIALLAVCLASPAAAKPQKKNPRATEALWKAVAAGDAAAARAAIKSGADVESRNENNATPLMTVAEEGKLEVLQAILAAKPALDATHPNGATALVFAASNQHPEAAMALVEAGASVVPATSDGWTALHSAAEFGYLDLASAALARGASVDARGGGGTTPLTLAVGYGRAEIVDLLLAKGAQVDTLDADGRTPLAVAAGLGDVAIVKRLLEARADVAKQGKGGRTALNAASVWGSRDVAAVLLKAGARVDATEEGGWQPIHQAAFNGHLALVKDLLAAGADKKLKIAEGLDAADLARDRGFLDVWAFLRGKKTAPAARFALDCAGVGGPVAATLTFEGTDAFLRVDYPKAYDEYRREPVQGLADTRLYVDVDGKPATGIDFEEALNGMDRSVEYYEMAGVEEGDRSGLNGKRLVSKVYQHVGGAGSSVADFEPSYAERAVVARIPLESLGPMQATKMRGVLQVGESCRTTPQPVAAAPKTAKR